MNAWSQMDNLESPVAIDKAVKIDDKGICSLF